MIDLTRADMSALATHYVGNSGLGEQMVITEKPYQFKSAVVKEVFFNFLLSGFKNDIHYHFVNRSEFGIGAVKDLVESIFEDKENLFDASIKIAENLYRHTVHPKAKGGELYVSLIKDVIVDGQLCDAVGIFKSESKETFIKVDIHNDTFDIDTDLGISPKKLDMGVLIFNIEKENGYKAVMIDKANKLKEQSIYWLVDFLSMKLKSSPYLHTSNYINLCIDFSEKVLTRENGVDEKDKMMILNNSMKYLDRNVEFNAQEFQNEVLAQQELIDAFNQNKEDFQKTYNAEIVDNFTISKNALKKANKYKSTTIVLDENFEINIKSRHDLIDKGYDDDKGMGFYKVYFVNELNKN
jgi:hypothetical protein